MRAHYGKQTLKKNGLKQTNKNKNKKPGHNGPAIVLS